MDAAQGPAFRIPRKTFLIADGRERPLAPWSRPSCFVLIRYRFACVTLRQGGFFSHRGRKIVFSHWALGCVPDVAVVFAVFFYSFVPPGAPYHADLGALLTLLKPLGQISFLPMFPKRDVLGAAGRLFFLAP